ncbi:MAG: cyclic nucleotide-binding domain-containing protein [Desulfobacterales bacterium]|jgi:CRP-like cAMP-binding protein|nr:cyclic nucleotide-binding domain-containing protein [Desulfobacterales bacterium]
MVTLEELDKIELFKGLNDGQLETIRKFCQKLAFNRGDRLFREGDPADFLWIVADGQVDLRFELPGNRPTSDQTTISTLSVEEQKKRILGWSCFVPPHQMRLSGYCGTRTCSVIKISKAELVALFEKDPQMGYVVMSYLVKVVGFRFNQFQDEIAKSKGSEILNAW